MDQGELRPRPTITVRNVKLFMDGVITGPANTGALVEPYLENRGTADKPDWVREAQNKPPVYFSAAVLPTILNALARAKIDPHLHVDGDGAVRAAFDGVAAMRRTNAGVDVRPAFAHCELVHPDDIGRFAALNVIPVLSMQWQKPAPDTVESVRNTLGAQRVRRIEPAGVLDAQGARIAFGSDWPVDRLDEWFALKVGVTRTGAPYADSDHGGRLGADPGLSRETVLRAATINAAYELHQEGQTGSLEVGKFADFIAIDRDVFTIPAEEIATVRVLLTVVGGEVVYDTGLVTQHPHVWR
jgi:predicted amidohydrolase YtcJ